MEALVSIFFMPEFLAVIYRCAFFMNLTKGRDVVSFALFTYLSGSQILEIGSNYDLRAFPIILVFL